ncbi:MAG: DUF2312 domain-containing protein [Magnetococcales bacterium]|nr:DUF2312 domain-containing protein [Magnetococcales bacterium]
MRNIEVTQEEHQEEGINHEALYQYINRIERLEEEKADTVKVINDVYSEAKGNGFDPKIMKEIVKIRKKSKEEQEEFETIMELYMKALGMK